MIAESAGRHPVSAQCGILGVARPTYYRLKNHPAGQAGPDPIEQDVVSVFHENRREYGARKIKRGPAKRGIVASRRRICRIMKEDGPASAYARAKSRPGRAKPNEAELPNLIAREFDGRAPRAHIVSDLTYVRVGGGRRCACLLVDLANREIAGHSLGPRKDAALVKSAFAALRFPISDIEVFHTDRGSEFDNAAIDEMLEVFGVERSPSAKGRPYDNAVIEPANRILKKGLICRRRWPDEETLRRELNSYMWWYNNERMRSTLGYMSPVEFREEGCP